MNHLQTPQIKTSIHDFAVSLSSGWLGQRQIAPFGAAWTPIPSRRIWRQNGGVGERKQGLARGAGSLGFDH
jgi:hypothetical protein